MTDHMPKRIQMSRKKGWRKPEGVVYCGRPSKWGNPFTLKEFSSLIEEGKEEDGRKAAVECFRAKLGLTSPFMSIEHNAHFARIRRDIEELRDQDLGCWCKLTDPCHVDVLLELANRPKEKP